MADKRREMSSYYTPVTLARQMVWWAVQEAVARRVGTVQEDLDTFLSDNKDRAGNLATIVSLRIVDPACGNGTLLREASTCIKRMMRLVYPEMDTGKAMRSMLYGIDLDPIAVNEASGRLGCGNIYLGNAVFGLMSGSSITPGDNHVETIRLMDEELLSRLKRYGARCKTPAIKTDGTVGKTIKREPEIEDVTALSPFHWAHQFRDIFESGGFDVVISNPPWDSFRPDSKEFFSRVDPGMKEGMTASEFSSYKKCMLRDPDIANRWSSYVSGFPLLKEWFKNEKHLRDPEKTNAGAPNLFVLFTRLSRVVLKHGGVGVLLLPSGITTDISCKSLRCSLFEEDTVKWIRTAHNRGMFEGVSPRLNYTMLGFIRGGKTESFRYTSGSDDPLSGQIVSVDDLRNMYPHTMLIPAIRDKEEGLLLSYLTKHFPIVGDFRPKRSGRRPKDKEKYEYGKERVTINRTGYIPEDAC